MNPGYCDKKGAPPLSRETHPSYTTLLSRIGNSNGCLADSYDTHDNTHGSTSLKDSGTGNLAGNVHNHGTHNTILYGQNLHNYDL